MSKLNQTGSTLIELIIYLSLLALITVIIFSYAWQINSQNQKVLVEHANLHTIYTALDRLACDLKTSDKIKIKTSKIDFKKQPKTIVECKTALQVISWQINQENSLLRIERQNKLNKKPVIAKVAENIKSFAIQQTNLKNGNVLVKVNIIIKQKAKFKKQILLRKNIKI